MALKKKASAMVEKCARGAIAALPPSVAALPPSVAALPPSVAMVPRPVVASPPPVFVVLREAGAHTVTIPRHCRALWALVIGAGGGGSSAPNGSNGAGGGGGEMRVIKLGKSAVRHLACRTSRLLNAYVGAGGAGATGPLQPNHAGQAGEDSYVSGLARSAGGGGAVGLASGAGGNSYPGTGDWDAPPGAVEPLEVALRFPGTAGSGDQFSVAGGVSAGIGQGSPLSLSAGLPPNTGAGGRGKFYSESLLVGQAGSTGLVVLYFTVADRKKKKREASTVTKKRAGKEARVAAAGRVKDGGGRKVA